MAYINRAELVGNLDRFAPEHLTPLIRTLIEKQPTADVVSVEDYKQVVWERDWAIEQLQSYGTVCVVGKGLKEVKLGKWIHVDWVQTDDTEPFHRLVKCPVCGIIDDRVTEYCPDCGAKNGRR